MDDRLKNKFSGRKLRITA